MTVSFTLLLALLLDTLLGEPKKGHPLVLFGRWVTYLEKRLILPSESPNINQKIAGFIAVFWAILPISGVVFMLVQTPLTYQLLSPVLLYLCIAPKSLLQHTQAVYQPLLSNDLEQARLAIARIVSRETAQMDQQAIRKATIESTLENGADAVFSPIFWFVIAGPVGVVFYRLSNTLDAMWGYKNTRYHAFGYTAARLDDILNWLPARLTALSYLILGNSYQAWCCYRQQSPQCESPNAGIVMSAGAGSLNVNLGGAAIYHGQLKIKPILGTERTATNEDILRANQLMIKTSVLWLALIALGESLA